MKNNQLSLLGTRRFLPLFATQFLGAFNDNVFKNALVILITYRLANLTHVNPQILVTLAAGIFILPFFLFSATAGQLADKYEKSKLIRIIKFFEIVIMVLAGVGFHFQSVNLLMFLLFALGMQATFFGPLKYAILPEQLYDSELIAGNGLIEAGTFVSILLGTILGGIFILIPQGVYVISAIIFLLALGGWLSSLFIPNTHQHDAKLHVNYNFITETYKLMVYSKERADIFLCVLGISWFWLIGAVFLAEFPVFGKDILHANEHVVTYFFTLFSVGLALGSLLCNRLLNGKVKATYVPLASIGITVFVIDLYFAANRLFSLPATELMSLTQFLTLPTGWRISFDLIMMAVCSGLYTVPLYALLQVLSDKQHRARVIASNNVMNALFMVLAAIVSMLMLKAGFTVTEVFLSIAIANAFVALYICKLLPDVIVKNFFHVILKLLYRVKVKGLENYHHAGKRVVIIANHTSFLDALLLAVFLPDKLTFAVNTVTAKQWWIKLFLRMVDAFSMDPTNPMAIKSLIQYVKQDKRCVIFPEGRITMTGSLMKVYEGPGLVSDKADAKLLPIRIQGAQYSHFSRLKGKVRLRWMPTITITIFPPQVVALPEELKGRKRRQKMALKLYDVMADAVFNSSDYRQTFFTSLMDAARVHGSDHKILEDIERNPLTYRQFLIRSFAIGGVVAKNTKAGEFVGVLLPNISVTALLFFGLHAFSRVPAMLNYSTGLKNLVVACQTADIKVVYTSKRFLSVAKLNDLVGALEAIGVKLIYLENLRSEARWTDKLKGFIRGTFPETAYRLLHHSKHMHAFLNCDKPAVLLFTSGSEGAPKGVVLSHANVQANRFQIATCVDLTSSDIVFNALPVFHSFGLTGGLLLPLLSGVKVFLYPSPLHYRIIPELVYDTNATLLFGTDTFLAAYARFAHQYDFYSVRYIFAGAEKLRDDTRQVWAQKLGVRLFEGYGATETSPAIAMNTPMYSKAGTVGRILPGIQHRLTSVPGVAEGGMLVVSGPNVMLGYLLASQPGVLVPPENGWYETGDIVSIDESGYVTIQGRVKRFAKIAGEMVSLTMVEQQLSQLWPQFQHAVINIPDARKGEMIILVTTNPHAAREEIAIFAKAQGMAEIAIPRRILFVKNMFLLGSGKVDYPAVKSFVLAG